MQDNVYGPPESDLHVPHQPAEGFGVLRFDRAIDLAWRAVTQNVGLSMGLAVLFSLLVILSIFTCFGILFLVPVLNAGLLMLGLMLIRGQASAAVLFSGFPHYGRVLLAALLLGLIQMAVSIPFSLPNIQYVFRHFPVDRIGIDPWTTIMQRYAQSAGASGANPLDADQLWRTLIAYGNFPVTSYFAGRLLLVFPLVIERNHSVLQAIKTSWSVTTPYQWWLLLAVALSGFLAPFGLVACCVGVFFTIPFATAIQGAVIYQLFGEDKASGT